MAGKSFADIVRQSAKDNQSKTILSRIEQIKEKAKKQESFSVIPPLKRTEQPNKRASKQASKHTPEQTQPRVREQVFEQVPKQVFEQAPEQTNTQTSKQAPTQPNTHTTTHTPEQTSNRTTEQPGAFNPLKKPSDLKFNQYQILHYIYFQRPFKVKGPNGISSLLNIKYGTVRNSLESLARKGYISKPFSINDGINNGSTCLVDENKCFKLFGPTETEQPDNRATEQATTQPHNYATKQTTTQPGNCTTAQVSSSYKLVSKYLNKLTNYLENSSFWSGQGLSVKKCEEWIKEFYPDDPEALITQLMFAEKTETVLKPKTKTSVHVFYGCLLNGGLTRPKDFEFPHERALRIKKQEIENQEKALAEIELLRQKEKMIADQLAFNDLLSNPENVDILINEIENKFLTPKTKISIQTYRKTGKIDSKLENALKREFDKPDEE